MRWGAGHNSGFSIINNYGMKMPSGFAGADPEFYFVAAVLVEERLEKVCNGNRFTLTRVM